MNLILDLLFPKKCVGCKAEGSYFCPDCIRNILQTDLVCPKCERQAMGGQTHPICKRRFGLDGLWSLGIYEKPLKQAIQTLKYKRVPELAEILVDITLEYWIKFQPFILEAIKKDGQSSRLSGTRGARWAVIPVPIHWWRENDRGFNQSSLIGQSLSKKLGLAYFEALKRIRYTKPQVGLKGRQRHQNIRNAFEMDSSLRGAKRRGNLINVLLIDDVWTTGSTLRECCYILKRAGAKKVWALTLAR